MYCQRCGNQLRSDARFCGVCGATANPPAPGQPPQPAPGGGYPMPTPYQAQPVQAGYPQPAPYGQPPAQAGYPAQPAYPQPVQYLQPLPTPSQPAPYAPTYPPNYYQPLPAGPAPNQYPQPVPPAPRQAANPNAPGPWQQTAVGAPPGSVVAPIIPGTTYPSYGRRAAAFLIDISLIFLFIAAAVVPMTGVLSGVNSDTLTVVLALIVSLASLAFLIWYPIVQPGRTGQTLGMRLLDIKVVDQKGKPPGIGKMAVRFLIGYPLCAIIMGVGFLVPLWDVQKQALDDKLVNTYVINA